jgi:hypothetical protein
METAAHLRNRSISRVMAKPYEVFYGKAADDTDHLRVFGCKAQITNSPVKRKKLDDVREVGVFGGDERNCKTWCIYVWREAKARFVPMYTANVKFFEDTRPDFSMLGDSVVTPGEVVFGEELAAGDEGLGQEVGSEEDGPEGAEANGEEGVPAHTNSEDTLVEGEPEEANLEDVEEEPDEADQEDAQDQAQGQFPHEIEEGEDPERRYPPEGAPTSKSHVV